MNLKTGRGGTRRVKLVLALLFAAGLCLVYVGAWGLRVYASSGFSSASAFESVYRLSQELDRDWKDLLSPALSQLSDEKRTAAEECAEALLRENWEERRAGAGGELDALLDGLGPSERAETAHRLLYITYQVGGPKVSAAAKKALSPGDAQSILEALTGGGELPEAVRKAVGKLEGSERQAMLTQLFYTALASGSHLKTDDVNSFKKGIRDKDVQMTAFRMIARGEIGGARMFVIANARSVVLCGVLLALDALLLALLMAAGRSWRFDVKWLFILAIADFLLVFQVTPLAYMVYKAFFPDASFSLETFRRLYTYPLNLDALKNTLIAAFAAMLIGTALAFPLAWLVGRTNLCGRRFFRSLFVLTYMVPPYVGPWPGCGF